VWPTKVKSHFFREREWKERRKRKCKIEPKFHMKRDRTHTISKVTQVKYYYNNWKEEREKLMHLYPHSRKTKAKPKRREKFISCK